MKAQGAITKLLVPSTELFYCRAPRGSEPIFLSKNCKFSVNPQKGSYLIVRFYTLEADLILVLNLQFN